MRIKHRGEDRLAAFLDQLGRDDDLARPRVVRSELAAVFEHGLPGRTNGVFTAELPVHSRRRSMLTALSGALATLTGKVVLGTAVAAASVGAAHSAGVIDVPGLPDTTPAVESPAVDAPGEDRTDVSGGQSAAPVGGSETADEHKPDTAPEGGDTATEHIPDDVPADVPTGRP